jgi:hypothetical protein
MSADDVSQLSDVIINWIVECRHGPMMTRGCVAVPQLGPAVQARTLPIEAE